MSYQVLALKWRPQNFEDVIGQSHITRTLQNAINSGRIGHAYIFTGPRGVGKTTTARIMAKALNCERGPTPHPCNKCSNCIEITENRFPDVVEIDGASNNSVDDIRDLIEKVNYRPVKGRYRIYIIDEVHMLSISAFNALLKTLEEPPPHVIFIFATTEPHKIPATIMSRCQRFDFRRIPDSLIQKRLDHILKEEGFKDISEETIRLISRAADGSLRDALSILDQVIALDPSLDPQNIQQILGFTGRNTARKLLKAVIHRQPKEIITILENEIIGKSEIKTFLKELLTYLDELIKAKLGLIEPEESAKKLISETSREELFHLFNGLNKIAVDVLNSPFPDPKFEVALLSLTSRPPLVSIEKLIDNIINPSTSTNTNQQYIHKTNEASTQSKKFNQDWNSKFTKQYKDQPKHSKPPFEELKSELISHKPNSLPIVGVMRFNATQHTIIIQILSSRQRDTLQQDPGLIPYIQKLADKYLEGAKVVVSDQAPKHDDNNIDRNLFTINDVKSSDVLKKILEKFEGRITKLIPERR